MFQTVAVEDTGHAPGSVRSRRVVCPGGGVRQRRTICPGGGGRWKRAVIAGGSVIR